MCKQDRQGVRTASELIQRYKFGETFAEIMGLAKEAKDTADNASGSADELDAKLTHEEIFNRLTKNGELQGLYRGDDGELYVNASYLKSGIIDAAVVQVVNLIAERLKSVNGTKIMEVIGAHLSMENDGKQYIALGASDFGSGLFVDEYDDTDTPMANAMVTGTMVSVAGQIAHFGFPDVAAIGIDPFDGRSYAQFSRLNEKNIEWKDNGDGTFSLIGR